MRHSSFLEINLGLLKDNFLKIQNYAPKTQLIPMVKADAYGNGLIPVSKLLLDECGVGILGCASLGEAHLILNEFPHHENQVWVFSDTEFQNEDIKKFYQDPRLVPVVHQKSDLEWLEKSRELSTLPLVIKVNTGMNRLGLSLEDLEFHLPLLKIEVSFIS